MTSFQLDSINVEWYLIVCVNEADYELGQIFQLIIWENALSYAVYDICDIVPISYTGISVCSLSMTCYLTPSGTGANENWPILILVKQRHTYTFTPLTFDQFLLFQLPAHPLLAWWRQSRFLISTPTDKKPTETQNNATEIRRYGRVAQTSNSASDIDQCID